MAAFKDIDFHGFVEGLIKTIELRDVYTSGHSKRVSELAELISREMGMDSKGCEYIHVAGHLHDIGKIGIPDGILLKTGKLSDAEYLVMQQHPAIGAAIFQQQKGFEKMAAIIKHHHERFDGRGYPDGLCGDDIPVGSSIIAIADSFDAMTTYRSYRRGLEPDDAILEIISNRGKQFHPDIADCFCNLYNRDKHRIDCIISGHNACSGNVRFAPFNSIKSASDISYNNSATRTDFYAEKVR